MTTRDASRVSRRHATHHVLSHSNADTQWSSWSKNCILFQHLSATSYGAIFVCGHSLTDRALRFPSNHFICCFTFHTTRVTSRLWSSCNCQDVFLSRANLSTCLNIHRSIKMLFINRNGTVPLKLKLTLTLL